MSDTLQRGAERLAKTLVVRKEAIASDPGIRALVELANGLAADIAVHIQTSRDKPTHTCAGPPECFTCAAAAALKIWESGS